MERESSRERTSVYTRVVQIGWMKKWKKSVGLPAIGPWKDSARINGSDRIYICQDLMIFCFWEAKLSDRLQFSQCETDRWRICVRGLNGIICWHENARVDSDSVRTKTWTAWITWDRTTPCAILPPIELPDVAIAGMLNFGIMTRKICDTWRFSRWQLTRTSYVNIDADHVICFSYDANIFCDNRKCNSRRTK